MAQKDCACSCGNVAFDLLETPLFRILCHCTICQRFNDAPFADVVVYDASSVAEAPEGTVRFNTYKAPPNVQRGKCVKCGNPAVEKFAAPLFPKLTIVPAAMHGESAEIPDPVAHIFYEKRVADVDDALPKRNGFVASQLSFGKYLLSGKLSKK
jgi:hypothetical protein